MDALPVEMESMILKHVCRHTYMIYVCRFVCKQWYLTLSEYPNFGGSASTRVAIRSWFKAHNIIFTNVMSDAIRAGDVKIVKWLRHRGFAWPRFGTADAAMGNSLPMLKYIREHGCDWNNSTAHKAVKAKNLEMLKYIYESDGPKYLWAIVYAAENNDMPMFKYLLEYKHCKGVRICAHAAANGNLEMLILARMRGCYWDTAVYHNALAGNHKEIFMFAWSHGCPMGADARVTAKNIGWI
jgi:hypothetical protein